MNQQTTNLPQPQTPLERLLLEKRRVKEACELRKVKLDADCAYIQANAGSLLLSGLSALLFPASGRKTSASADNAKTEAMPSGLPLSVGDMLAVGKSMLPLVWDMVRPMLMAWGVQKAQKWLIGLLLKKKK